MAAACVGHLMTDDRKPRQEGDRDTSTGARHGMIMETISIWMGTEASLSQCTVCVPTFRGMDAGAVAAAGRGRFGGDHRRKGVGWNLLLHNSPPQWFQVHVTFPQITTVPGRRDVFGGCGPSGVSEVAALAESTYPRG